MNSESEQTTVGYCRDMHNKAGTLWPSGDAAEPDLFGTDVEKARSNS